MRTDLLRLDAATYASHPLHGHDRSWPETNCYVDLWIELLHALGLDPVAALAFTVAVDFEGDQWTFCKHPHGDLYALYGIDVQELTIWRPLAHHVAEQLALRRPVLVEVDSYFLPDTAGVAYHREHTKTTIAVQAFDLATRTIGYFHNAGYYTLGGDDFDGVLHASALAPYTEIAKLDGIVRRSPEALTALAVERIRHALERRPRTNPVTRYRERFLRDVEWLMGEELATFHQYAFATLRQCGACAELTSTFLRWLEQHGEHGLEPAAAEFERIASSAKALQFKVARAVSTRKSGDFVPLLDTMAAAWDGAMTRLVSRYAG